jgi:hypothetical protein
MKITSINYELEPGEAPDMVPNLGSYRDDVRFRPGRVEVNRSWDGEIRVRVVGLEVREDNTTGTWTSGTVLAWHSWSQIPRADWPEVAPRAIRELEAFEARHLALTQALPVIEEHSHFIDGPDEPYQPHALAVLWAARVLAGQIEPRQSAEVRATPDLRPSLGDGPR